MSAHDRDRLDAAIDQVARSLVDVRENADLAQRIAAALPERSAPRWWWLMPQLAALGLAVAAVLVWTPRSHPPAPGVLPASAPAGLATLPEAVLASEPGTAVRTPVRTAVRTPFEPVELSVVEFPDHERSLPAVAGPEAIALGDLTPSALPATESLTLPSIAPVELALTTEQFLISKEE